MGGDSDVIVSLLKAALGVVGFLFVSLIGIVAYFLKGFAHEVAKVGDAVRDMSKEYAVTKEVVAGVKERVNGIAEKHSARIEALERQGAGMEHDLAAVKARLERMETNRG